MAKWNVSEIPSQKGRLAVVTGTGGLGLEDALALTRAGAAVIIAGRNAASGAEAVARVRAEVPPADVRFEELDLASLSSIEAFAARLAAQRDRLDLLVNNAAVMAPPTRLETSDGFELQLGTNYLGHFALTLRLVPLLRRGHEPRVVTLSSVAARGASIDFDDLQSRKRYAAMTAYGQSKLACLMFALELQRRSEAAGWGITSIGAHPGITRTGLIHKGLGRFSLAGLARTWLWFLFQPAARGALPTLFAATSTDAKGGAYYGPDKLGETRGSPAPAKLPMRAADQNTAARLWDVSEQLTLTSAAGVQ